MVAKNPPNGFSTSSTDMIHLSPLRYRTTSTKVGSATVELNVRVYRTPSCCARAEHDFRPKVEGLRSEALTRNARVPYEPRRILVAPGQSKHTKVLAAYVCHANEW